MEQKENIMSFVNPNKKKSTNDIGWDCLYELSKYKTPQQGWDIIKNHLSMCGVKTIEEDDAISLLDNYLKCKANQSAINFKGTSWTHEFVKVFNKTASDLRKRDRERHRAFMDKHQLKLPF